MREPSPRGSGTWRPAAAGIVVVLVIAAVGFVVERSSGPHGPSTGLQATRTLHLEFPPIVEGSALDSAETALLTGQLAPLKARVPALALSTQVQYHSLGAGDSLFVAGGPLPSALRFLGNAEQAHLVGQIGAQIGGPHRVHPHGWGPKPTGALGGQMWCGTEQPGGDATIGLCYVVDSQNLMIITTFGDDALTTAEQVRAQVEVPAN